MSMLQANQATTPPRSQLNSLLPINAKDGQGESLSSYLARLASSHSVSPNELARYITQQQGQALSQEFEISHRNISGIDDAAEHWSQWLTEMTGQSDLDLLTLLPLRGLVANRSLTKKGHRYCPCCLEQDKQHGVAPHFRLLWSMRAVNVCPVHQTTLISGCRHCGKPVQLLCGRAGLVGWCSHCGHFLGSKHDLPAKVDSAELKQSSQIEALLATSQTAIEMGKAELLLAINDLACRLDQGKMSQLARRIGYAKSTVFGWLDRPIKPEFSALLDICRAVGVDLVRLVTNQLHNWVAPDNVDQLTLPLTSGPAPRTIDWKGMEERLKPYLLLDEALNVTEIGRQLDVSERSLYCRLPHLARALGERYKWQQANKARARQLLAVSQLKAVRQELLAQGKELHLRELDPQWKRQHLSQVASHFRLVRMACS